MITQMGFSKKLGQVAWSGGGGPSFLGQSMGQPQDCSGETSDEIDNEVKELVNRAYRCALPCKVLHLFALYPLMLKDSRLMSELWLPLCLGHYSGLSAAVLQILQKCCA